VTARSADEDSLLSAVRNAAWFRYIRPEHRAAARHLRELAGSEEVDWDSFDDARRDSGATFAADEHAGRAWLLASLRPRHPDAVTVLREQFPRPGDLARREAEHDAMVVVEGRDGIDAPMRRRAVLKAIADSLLAQAQLPLPR